jgi:hypothetical protein
MIAVLVGVVEIVATVRASADEAGGTNGMMKILLATGRRTRCCGVAWRGVASISPSMVTDRAEKLRAHRFLLNVPTKTDNYPAPHRLNGTLLRPYPRLTTHALSGPRG